jgi:hypothetical protein
LGHSARPATLYPGDVIELDAYWQAVRTPRQEQTFLLSLRDASGMVHASREIAPVDSYPETNWNRGEVVRGQYRLRIPADAPAGPYTCHIRPIEEPPLRRLLAWTRPDAQLCHITLRAPDATRSFEIPTMQHTLGINLNDEIELLGFDLAPGPRGSGSPARPAAAAGGAVGCTLYWRALQSMEHNYTVFTHLVDVEGRTWGQWDNQPQQGQSPTARWVPGQVVADPYQIPLAAETPAGPLELRVGMYDRNTMLRLPVYGPDGQIAGDHVTLATVEVTRP